MNLGAKIGGFAHSTGEGGVSPYQLENNGDLIWEIGAGYFDCRTKIGLFCEEAFAATASHENIRMVEIKLSQGAKPGHGGILPATKNTTEIADIRGVEPYTTALSLSVHSAFATPVEMMVFLQKLRDLSGGKSTGFKLCVGRPSEFISLCQAMIRTGIRPVYITVDGA